MMFRPSRPDRIEEPIVRRLQFARAWTGILVMLWVAMAYQVVSPEDAASERVNEAYLTMVAMCCAFPIVVGVFIGAARPPNRGLFLRRSLLPLVAVVVQFGAAYSFVLAAAPEYQGLRNWAMSFSPAVKPVAGVVLLWLVPFTLYGLLLSLTHVFRTTDIHELVPPLLTTTLSWVMALVDLFTDAYRGVPAGVAALLLLGAPLSVTAIAAFEVRRLNRHHGVTLRGALLRRTP